jgi:hypothetical protein
MPIRSRPVDEATLERLRGLAHDCLTLIVDEKVRRNPEPKFDREEYELIQARRVRALYEAEMAERKKRIEDGKPRCRKPSRSVPASPTYRHASRQCLKISKKKIEP